MKTVEDPIQTFLFEIPFSIRLCLGEIVKVPIWPVMQPLLLNGEAFPNEMSLKYRVYECVQNERNSRGRVVSAKLVEVTPISKRKGF